METIYITKQKEWLVVGWVEKGDGGWFAYPRLVNSEYEYSGEWFFTTKKEAKKRVKEEYKKQIK